MKNALFALLLSVLVPIGASALEVNDDLVTIAAMPLAVAAVADITDIPTNELINLIATMNQAQVPAPQFIEVVRYAPIALVDTSEPFVPYVTTQVESGVRGQDLALVMEDRIERYDGADTINVVSPPQVVYIDRPYYDTFYPEVVVTRFQPVRTIDPLALVAMPLAVAAASEITGVPAMELASLVTMLNQARMPPAQFVEVVRYSPVALVDRDPAFLTFVTTEVSDGRRGLTLAQSLEDRLETLGARDIDVIHPPQDLIVASRASAHPHGGPPGQLKKELGLQTGAEVVHGTHPGRERKAARVASTQRSDRTERVTKPRGNSSNRGSSERVAKVRETRKAERVREVKPQRVREAKPERIRVAKPDRAPQPQQPQMQQPRGNSGNSNKGNSGGGNPNKGNGNGKGKGKG